MITLTMSMTCFLFSIFAHNASWCTMHFMFSFIPSSCKWCFSLQIRPLFSPVIFEAPFLTMDTRLFIFSFFSSIHFINAWNNSATVVCSLSFFTTIFNILGHQRRFRHRAWKVRQIWSEALISAWGSFTCRESTTWATALLPFRRKSYSGFLHCEKFHRPRPGLDPRTSDPVVSMITSTKG